MQTENVDVLVIGAGPSGTVAASIIKMYGSIGRSRFLGSC
jgi:flavin-dependent dehydrogenase